jgi:hypothetical protein
MYVLIIYRYMMNILYTFDMLYIDCTLIIYYIEYIIYVYNTLYIDCVSILILIIQQMLTCACVSRFCLQLRVCSMEQGLFIFAKTTCAVQINFLKPTCALQVNEGHSVVCFLKVWLGLCMREP